jgi:transposase
MGQITVFSGAERRRRWSREQKQALLEAAFAPGAVVSEVARAADIRANQVYRWRRELSASPATVSGSFAAVVVNPDRPEQVHCPSAAVMIVEVSGAVVRITADAPAVLISATLRALVR